MKCCFCGKKISGYGNSCWPIYENEDLRCCDKCNIDVVIRERLKQFKIYEEQKKETN